MAFFGSSRPVPALFVDGLFVWVPWSCAVPKELWSGAEVTADVKNAVRNQRREAAAKLASAQAATLSRFGTVLSAGSGVKMYKGLIEHAGETEHRLLPCEAAASSAGDVAAEAAYVEDMAAARLREQVCGPPMSIGRGACVHSCPVGYCLLFSARGNSVFAVWFVTPGIGGVRSAVVACPWRVAGWEVWMCDGSVAFCFCLLLPESTCRGACTRKSDAGKL